MKELKVGDSFEVVEATKNGFCRGALLYNKSDFGVCIEEHSFYVVAIIGSQKNRNMGWLIGHGEFKKVGNLTITKLKHS